jgi:hypothetical protein
MKSRILICSVLSVFSSIRSIVAQDSLTQSKIWIRPGVYTEGSDGHLYAATNVNTTALWPGVWKEDTNGLRVQLYIETKWVQVGVGSIVHNSLGEYIGPPSEKCAHFELRDSNGVVVPFVKGMSLEGQFASRLSLNDFPRWPNGGLKVHIGFFTNGGPFTLMDVNLENRYLISKPDDYTLTICPVIYKFETNGEYLDRVDLPCVTTQVHLTPSQ